MTPLNPETVIQAEPTITQPSLAVILPILRRPFTTARASAKQSTIGGGAQKLTMLAIACFEGQVVRTRDISDLTSYSDTQTYRAIQILIADGLVESEPVWRSMRRLRINRTKLRHDDRGAGRRTA